jgi:threonine synthase
MDILLSSNLERLLYLASFDDELVSEKMHELKEKGRYELSEENVKTIKTDFEAYYLDETDTSEEIDSIFKEHSYLIDSHTAIASGALKLFREESGDSSVAVVLSTASPYKFAEFVLSSISDIEENNSDPIGRLKVLSGVEIPEYIKTIKTRPLRFKEVVKREEMKEKVLIFGSAQ